MSTTEEVIRTPSSNSLRVQGGVWINLRKITARFGLTEVVPERARTLPNTINLPLGVCENHPLIPAHGVFRDDPTWDSFIESIREYRRQVNELEDL